MRAGVQPGHATSHDFDLQLAFFKVNTIDIGDFQLTARGGLDTGCDVAHLLIIKIQSRDRVVGLGFRRLFLDADRATLRIKTHHTITLRVQHVISKHRRALRAGIRGSELRIQIMTVVEVVTQDQR